MDLVEWVSHVICGVSIRFLERSLNLILKPTLKVAEMFLINIPNGLTLNPTDRTIAVNFLTAILQASTDLAPETVILPAGKIMAVAIGSLRRMTKGANDSGL